MPDEYLPEPRPTGAPPGPPGWGEEGTTAKHDVAGIHSHAYFYSEDSYNNAVAAANPPTLIPNPTPPTSFEDLFS